MDIQLEKGKGENEKGEQKNVYTTPPSPRNIVLEKIRADEIVFFLKNFINYTVEVVIMI